MKSSAVAVGRGDSRLASLPSSVTDCRQAGRQSRATIPLISGGEGFTSTTAEHQAGDHSAHNSRAGQ